MQQTKLTNFTLSFRRSLSLKLKLEFTLGPIRSSQNHQWGGARKCMYKQNRRFFHPNCWIRAYGNYFDQPSQYASYCFNLNLLFMSFSATLLGVIKYRVCPGDSLLSIALQFATTVRALQALNKIGPHSDAIVPNQVGSKAFTSAFNLPLDYSCSARAKRWRCLQDWYEVVSNWIR